MEDAVALSAQASHSVWQATPIGILTLGVDGEVCAVNPAGDRIFSKSMLGSSILDLAHPTDQAALRQMIDEASRGQLPERQEIRFCRPDGVEVVVGLSVAPLDQQEPGPMLCVIRDITKERVFGPQLLHAEKMATMGSVAASVAHALNNPLAGVRGCLELMQESCTAEQMELIKMALSEIERAAVIVQDLEGYARRSEGLSDNVSVPDVLRRLLRTRKYGGHTDVGVQVVCPPSLPPLLGDENQILQALINLVRNAEQAVIDGPELAREVRIVARRVEDTVVIEVIDRGPGVSAEIRRKLFDPFFSTRPPGEGTGLGLTVVQTVAHGHGGRVEVDDTPDGGATFRLVLPHKELATRDVLKVGAERPKASFPEGTTLLVADDEPVLRRVVRRVCVSLGIEVVEAQDAPTAISALESNSFDLVLLDVRMPGGGGVAVYESIKSNRPHLVSRTVFMTGQLDERMREHVGTGYGGFITKPFQLKKLVRTLRDTLASSERA